MGILCSECGEPLREVLVLGKPAGKRICVTCEPPAGRCPLCGKPLRTPTTQRCMHCHADWYRAAAGESAKGPASLNPRQSNWLGALYKVVGVILIVPGCILWFALETNRVRPLGIPLGTAVALRVVSLVGAVVGGILYVRGKKHTAALAGDLLARGERPPILYLRSFADDLADAEEACARWSWPSLAIAEGTASREERVAALMGRIGPFVAIGRPGEPLPELGAARMYVSDEEWQEKVGEMLDAARLVVLRAGHTPGLRWEMGRVVQRSQPTQVLLLLPSRAAYRQFRDWANGVLPRPLPEDVHDAPFLTFDEDWTPRPLKWRVSGWLNDPYFRTLESFFEQNGITPPRPKPVRLWFLIIVLGLPVLLFIILLLLVGRP